MKNNKNVVLLTILTSIVFLTQTLLPRGGGGRGGGGHRGGGGGGHRGGGGHHGGHGSHGGYHGGHGYHGGGRWGGRGGFWGGAWGGFGVGYASWLLTMGIMASATPTPQYSYHSDYDDHYYTSAHDAAKAQRAAKDAQVSANRAAQSATQAQRAVEQSDYEENENID
jgi:hypothetical protein